MSQGKSKKVKKNNRFFRLILLGIVFYVSWTLISQQIKLRELLQEEEAYNKKIRELKSEVAKLQEEINQGNSPEFIEKVAREQLKMVKPNEIIYIDSEKSKYDGEKR